MLWKAVRILSIDKTLGKDQPVIIYLYFQRALETQVTMWYNRPCHVLVNRKPDKRRAPLCRGHGGVTNEAPWGPRLGPF